MENNKEYYESLDKRSKKYKEWKASQSKGLGDKIETLFKVTGIKSVVEFINNGECEVCKRRKQVLNKWFPEIIYNETKGQLTANQKETLNYIGLEKDVYTSDEASLLEGIYNQVNHTNIRICRTCPSSAKEWRTIVNRLKLML